MQSPETAGASHDSPSAQTCTFEVSAFENTTKIPREELQAREERVKMVVGDGKKRAKFWAVLEGRSWEGGPGEGGWRAVLDLLTPQ